MALKNAIRYADAMTIHDDRLAEIARYATGTQDRATAVAIARKQGVPHAMCSVTVDDLLELVRGYRAWRAVEGAPVVEVECCNDGRFEGHCDALANGAQIQRVRIVPVENDNG